MMIIEDECGFDGVSTVNSKCWDWDVEQHMRFDRFVQEVAGFMSQDGSRALRRLD